MTMASEWFDLNLHILQVLHGLVNGKANTETLHKPRALKPFSSHTHLENISASFVPQPAENHTFYYKKLMSHPQCKYGYWEEKYQKTTTNKTKRSQT